MSINKMDNYPIYDSPTSVYKLNGFSLQELLSQFWKHINEVIEGTNLTREDMDNLIKETDERLNAQDKILSEFIEWVKNEALPTLVEEEILKMYEDGRLEELIDKILFEKLNKEMKEMEIQSLPNFSIPEYRMTLYRKKVDDNLKQLKDKPAEIQGVAHVKDNIYVLTLCSMNKPLINAPAEIVEIDLTEKFNPKVTRRKTIIGLEKANTCTYDNGKLYVALSTIYNDDGSSYYVSKIAVVNYETWEIEEFINIPELSYINYVSSYHGQLYTLHNNKIYAITSNQTIKEVVTLKDFVNTGVQGFDIYEGYVYVNNSNSNMITIYNFETGKRVKDVSFAHHTNLGQLFEYTSDICVVNGDIVFSPHLDGDSTTSNPNKRDRFSDSSYYINYIAKIGLVSGGNASSTINSNYDRQAIFVNTNTPEGFYYCSGSNANPFRLLSEYFQNIFAKNEGYILRSLIPRLEYYGVLNLSDVSYNLIDPINCYGLMVQNFYGTILDINIDSRSLDIVPFTFLNSFISSINMKVENSIREGFIATSYINNHVAISHICTVSNSYVKNISNENTKYNGYSQGANVTYSVEHIDDEHIYNLKVESSFSPRYLSVQFKYKELQSYSFMLPNNAFKTFEDITFKVPDLDNNISVKYDNDTKQVKFKGNGSNNIRQFIAVVI